MTAVARQPSICLRRWEEKRKNERFPSLISLGLQIQLNVAQLPFNNKQKTTKRTHIHASERAIEKSNWNCFVAFISRSIHDKLKQITLDQSSNSYFCFLVVFHSVVVRCFVSFRLSPAFIQPYIGQSKYEMRATAAATLNSKTVKIQ